MSDHRCSLKIEFSIYSKQFEWDTSINYHPNQDSIDQRIIDWFDNCYSEARAAWDHQNAIEDQAKEVIEQSERAELARLKAKYESDETNSFIGSGFDRATPEPDADASGVMQSSEDWAAIGIQLVPEWTEVYGGQPGSFANTWDRMNAADGGRVRWVNPSPLGTFTTTGITCTACGHVVTLKVGDVIRRGDPRLCVHLGGPSDEERYEEPSYWRDNS